MLQDIAGAAAWLDYRCCLVFEIVASPMVSGTGTNKFLSEFDAL